LFRRTEKNPKKRYMGGGGPCKQGKARPSKKKRKKAEPGGGEMESRIPKNRWKKGQTREKTLIPTPSGKKNKKKLKAKER